MKKKYIVDYFSELMLNTKYDRLPENVVNHTKKNLLDYCGSLIVAKIIDSTPIVIKLAEDLGGEKECTIIGSKNKVSNMNAIFANAVQGYSFDFIDDHNESKAHPSAATIPTALSLCEKYKKSGKELIETIAIGNETVARLGQAFLGNMVKQCFHPTAVLGTFGATAAAAKCLGLSHKEYNNAQGLATGCMASGLYAWNSGNNYAKRVNAGHPARNGVLAAQMGKYGFLGPLDVYEGEFGAFSAFGYNRGWDVIETLKDMGNIWSFARSSIKPYPCCRYGGQNIDACIDIITNNKIDLNNIKSITASTQSAQIELLMEPKNVKYNPQSIVDMQFSLPYQVAITLIKGDASVDEFNLNYLNDPMVKKLMPLVKAEVNEEFEKRYPNQYSSSIIIKMNDGTKYSSVIDNPLGDWRNPVTKDFIIKKFKHLASKSIDDKNTIDEIVETILNIEEINDCSKLMRLINYV